MNNCLFTSESVTEGHPDKVCDRISDSILDAILAIDKDAHVACETFVTTNKVYVMGEISTIANIDIESIVREAIRYIGYTDDKLGFNADTCAISIVIDKQSPDIAMGVNKSLEHKSGDDDEDNITGAGDQGMMFGFASDETKEFMPLAISLSHKLAKQLTKVRKDGILDYLRPDGKTQVTVEYENGTPKRIDTIVVSTQHNEKVTLEKIRQDLISCVINEIIPETLLDANTKILINPTGRFVIGGPAGDTGLTGRKIIVDTYGGYSRHGGGAFSGKDPSKVDRSAAYYSRYIAKNIVAAGLAKECEVQLAYAIGVAKPVSIMINTFGTNIVEESKILSAVNKVFDCRPSAIIRELDLLNTEYTPVSSYGHMGREDLPVKWEKTDKVEELKDAI